MRYGYYAPMSLPVYTSPWHPFAWFDENREGFMRAGQVFGGGGGGGDIEHLFFLKITMFLHMFYHITVVTK